MDDIILGNDRAFWRSGMTCGYNAAPCGVVEQKASDNQSATGAAGAKTGSWVVQKVRRVGRAVECTGLGARSMCACEANLPSGKLSAKGAAGAKTGSKVVQKVRRVGRAVECTGLENRQGLTVLVSSNLTPSAINVILLNKNNSLIIANFLAYLKAYPKFCRLVQRC